jgi:hypothetical protein
MTNLTPALWIGDSSITATKLGNLTIGNGNLVVSDPAVVTGTTRDGCRDFSDANTSDGSANLASTITFPTPPTTTPPTPRGTVISDNRNLPSIQRVNNNITEATGATIGDRTNNNIPAAVAGAVTFGSTGDKAYKLKADDPARSATGSTVAFAASDCKNIKSCRYYYDPASSGGLTYNDVDVITDGVAKTTLLLQEDLTINATTNTNTIDVGSNSNFGSSDGFEIYVTGSGNDITINATNGSTINIRAFIHARDSKLTITGNGTVNIFGSVWVNDFENTNTGTVNISPDNIKTSGAATAGDRAYLFYATTPGRTPKPLTGSPTNWKTEEVN